MIKKSIIELGIILNSCFLLDYIINYKVEMVVIQSLLTFFMILGKNLLKKDTL